MAPNEIISHALIKCFFGNHKDSTAKMQLNKFPYLPN